MKIEYIEISKVKPNQKNPRKISEGQLEKLMSSIKKFPQMLELRPLIIDKNGTVIGGNMRLLAAQKLGLKKIPVIKAVNLTLSQVKQFIIRDNISFGEWDWEVLKEWDSSSLASFGLPVPFEGHPVNSMAEGDIDITEKFDPIGKSKGLQRVVLVFDSPAAAEEWLEKAGKFEIKKYNNAWQINLSSQSI